jgi:SAM-dependent methyltransferase
MYAWLKKMLRILVPGRVLFRYESWFRIVPYLFFTGRRYRCNICGSGLREFIRSGSDRICPRCGSIDRVRRLYTLLESGFLSPGIDVLDFSPSRSLYRKMKKMPVAYTASDLSGDFISDVSWDITAIPAPDRSYDLVLCYHVLEHVEDDLGAMCELRRILRKGGRCLIQTPFREGETYEDPAISTPRERAMHFGQEDHVRIYTASGLKKRLETAGFRVDILEFHEDAGNIHGLREQEMVLLCTIPE